MATFKPSARKRLHYGGTPGVHRFGYHRPIRVTSEPRISIPFPINNLVVQNITPIHFISIDKTR